MAKRKHTDYRLFLKMARAGKDNEEIRVAMKWRAGKKDRHQRVRALKSLARTKGLIVDGNQEFLKETNKEKTKSNKEAESKVEAA